MTWFKVDDSFCDHPKVEELLCDRYAADAIALWTLAGSWCAKHLTDGVISVAKVSRLGIKKHEEAARELVRVGLWIEADGGFRFRDWVQYQPTKEAVTADRQRANERQRRHRAASRITTADKPVTANVTPNVTRDKRCDNAVSHRGPTRPDPTRPIDIVPSELVTPASPVRPPPDSSGEFDVESPSSPEPSEPDSRPVQTEHGAIAISDAQTPRHRPSKPSEPDYAPRIAELENAYPNELVVATRLACQRSRRSGRMSQSIWLGVLEKLGGYAPEIVVSSMRVFVDRYSTGEHDEKYLLGIVRGESERHRKTTTGWRPPVAPEAYRESATTQQELDQLYGDLTPEDFARVERLGNRRTHG